MLRPGKMLAGNVEIWPTGRKSPPHETLPHRSPLIQLFSFLVQYIFAQLQGICVMCITGDNDDSLFMPSVLLSQCLWRALERALCCVSALSLISCLTVILSHCHCLSVLLLYMTLQPLTTQICSITMISSLKSWYVFIFKFYWCGQMLSKNKTQLIKGHSWGFHTVQLKAVT